MELIEGFKLLSKKLFSQEVIFPKGFSEYKIALEICKNIEGVTGKDQLLLTLFDIIYLENGQPRKEIDSNLLKYFELCVEDKLDDDDSFYFYIINEKENLSNYLVNNKIFTSEEITLLSFIIKIKKDFNLFFKCFEVIYAEKCAQFIPSENSENKFETKSFDDYLNDFSLCYYLLDTKSKGYFSLTYDDEGWFVTKEKTVIDYQKFKSWFRKSKINDLIDFIQKNTIINQEIQIQKAEEVKKESSVINLETLIKKIERLELEIEEMKKREIKRNNTLKKTLSNLKIENDKILNDIKIENDKRITNLEYKNLKLESQNSKIAQKLEQLKFANNRLTKDLNKMKKEFDYVKGRGVSKAIIDFIGYVFGEKDMNKRFSEKVDFINNILDSQIKKKETKETQLLIELKELIIEIGNKKIEADKLAHSEISLESLLGLVSGCENAKKILLDLDLSLLIKNYNEIYNMKMQQLDFNNTYETILKIMDNKKILFLNKFGLNNLYY